MARLEPKTHAPPNRRQLHRYRLDKAGLLAWFGGEKRLSELCETFGVPPMFTVASRNSPTNAHGVQITLANVCLMLELAERMHKPLDLYQHLVEVR